MFSFNKYKKVLVVAEISANHGQNFKKAVELIKKAAECGVDAVKFQTYTQDTITIDSRQKYFQIKHPKWGGQSLYQLYKSAYTPWSWFKKLKQVTDDCGLMFFSTAFDRISVDFLEELGVLFHKIASFELVDLPLIEYISKTGKPLIISTGMGSIEEIREALNKAKKSGASEVMLLKCVSAYPAQPCEMNLHTITDMQKRFGCPVGLSDHTLGIGVAVAAVPLGIKLVEKHFISSRRFKTPDSFFSLEPRELKGLIENIRIAQESMGKVHYGLTQEQMKNKIFRRSLFVVEDMKAGDIFSRPGQKELRDIHGRRVHRFYHATYTRESFSDGALLWLVL